MDVPRWYGDTGHHFYVENQDEFPELAFIAHFSSGPFEPYTKDLSKDLDLAIYGELYVTPKKDYAPEDLEAFPDWKSPVRKKYRAIALSSVAQKYYNAHALPDPLKHVSEFFRLEKKPKGGLEARSHRLVFSFEDRSDIAVASKDVDPKNPRFWLTRVRDFRVTGTSKFPGSDFALIEIGLKDDFKVHWDGSRIHRLEDGKTYEPAGEDFFYVVYALPTGTWDKVPKDKLAWPMSQEEDGYRYLGGFFTGKSAKAGLTTIEIRGESGPAELFSPTLTFFYPPLLKATPIPDRALSAETPEPVTKETLPAQPDRRLFWGVPLLAAVCLAGVWWYRRRRAPKA